MYPMHNHECHFQLSNSKMTIKVHVKNGIIMTAAPIVSCFIGQPLDNLAAWMRKMGPTDVTGLESHD